MANVNASVDSNTSPNSSGGSWIPFRPDNQLHSILGDGVCFSGEKVSPVALSNEFVCADHFYCPNISSSNPISVPQLCPPTISCQLLRLQSLFCTPQGTYEPSVCPKGYYCPNFTTKIICPAGSWCPIGQTAPIPCLSLFSSCPEGSVKQTYYGGLIFCGLADGLLLLLFLIMRCTKFIRTKRRNKQQKEMNAGWELGVCTKSRSKKQANFFTALDEDEQDGVRALGLPIHNRIDTHSDTSVDADKSSKSLLSTRFWLRKKEAIVNGLGARLPFLFRRPPSSAEAPTDTYLPTIINTSPITPAGISLATHGGIEREAEENYGNLLQQAWKARTPDPLSPTPPIVEQSQDNHRRHHHHISVQSLSVKVNPSTVPSLRHRKRFASPEVPELLRGFKLAQGGVDLSLQFYFEDLALSLPSGKVILNGVSGTIIPKRVTVIMGPSGAGKSTFMNVLMGKSARTGGRLLINNLEVEMQKYKKLIGYVPQDDVMLSELTVRENIEYSARIRLPPSWTHKYVSGFVDAILQALDLQHVAENHVSSISGGQRKRVNIGMELVSCPSALFLDEPTSGLDATSALKIMRTIKKIACTIGITIVTVIHQPRFEIFEEFDDILLVAPGGLSAYIGPCSEVVGYFERLGFFFDQRNNPADTLMDILSGKGYRTTTSEPDSTPQHGQEGNGPRENEECDESKWHASLIVDAWKFRELRDHSDNSNSNSTLVSRVAPSASSSSSSASSNASDPAVPHSQHSSVDSAFSANRNTCAPYMLDLASTTNFLASNASALVNGLANHARAYLGDAPHLNSALSHQRLTRACISRGASVWYQAFLAHNRSLTQQFRRYDAFLMEIGVAIITGCLMGVATSAYDGGIYQGVLVAPYTFLSPSPVEVVVPMISLIIGCCIGLAGAPAAVKIFSEELHIYWREAAAGHSPLAYFSGKNVASLYRFFFSSIHFTSFFHFLACPNINFFRLWLLHWLIFFCVYGLAFCTAMLVRRENAALIAVCVCMVASVLCGGGPTLASARRLGFGWILEMSYDRWATEAWFGEEARVFENVYEIRTITATHFGYNFDRFWTDLLYMLFIGNCYRVIAFALMVFRNRHLQR